MPAALPAATPVGLSSITTQSDGEMPSVAAAFGGGIADAKLGEEWFAGQIFEPESLLAAELAARATLPIHGRQIGRSMSARELGFPAGGGRGIPASASGFIELHLVQGLRPGSPTSRVGTVLATGRSTAAQ